MRLTASSRLSTRSARSAMFHSLRFLRSSPRRNLGANGSNRPRAAYHGTSPINIVMAEVRSVPVHPYIIFYRVHYGIVAIAGVLDGRRNLAAALGFGRWHAVTNYPVHGPQTKWKRSARNTSN